MEIKARVALSLPNTFYKVKLRYDTYQKASYDSYLVASLYKNAKTKAEAFKYIDEVCGQGSLNPHFKNLYEEISKFTESQIDGILQNSLYPVTMMVTDHFKYYAMFDATRFRNRVFEGNLSENEELLKKIMMPKEKGSTFLDIDFQKEAGDLKRDVYDAVFSEEKIMVNLDDNTYLPISKEVFNLVYEGQAINIDAYPGKVTNNITQGQWNVLSQQILDALLKERFVFKDKDDNLGSISNDYYKVTSIINVFGIYFYKETKYDFTKANASRCEEVIKNILENGWIEEYKVKSLVRVLYAVSDETAQDVVNYILNRKDSREIAEVGLALIKGGLEKNWVEEALRSMKKFATPLHINYLYKIDNGLGYSIDELLQVDKNLLSEEHAKEVRDYTAQRNNMIDLMNKMVGEIMNSGVREKMKGLKTKDSVYKQLNDFIKVSSAHLKKDYSSMDLKQLTKEYDGIKRVYEGPFQNIKERLTKEENKA